MTAQPETAASTSPAERPPILLALAGLLWMAGLLWSARATITGGNDAEMEVTSTAYALPGATSAGLVAGAAAALAVLAAVGRLRTPGPTLRFAIATGTGLVLGLLGALVIITINTDGWIYAVVGGTIAAAATIGGALAGLRTPRVLQAICWAAIAVFVVGFAVNYLPVLDIFGRGGAGSAAAAAQVASAGWFSLVQAVVSGLAAGLVAYRSLRRASRPFGWPLYALAGAGPGLLLVLAEVLARTAGARVLELAGKVSELELTVQQTLSTARLDSALIVLFVGAVTAIIAIGRTIKPDPPAQ